MIDAYTIGIRLALSDDLSNGLTAVQRKLAGLDRAIGRTGAALHALSRSSMEIAPPDFSRPGRWQGSRTDERRWPVAPSAGAAPARATLAEMGTPRPIWNARLTSAAASLPDWTAAARLLPGWLPVTPGAGPRSGASGETPHQQRTGDLALPPAWATKWSRTSPSAVDRAALPRLRMVAPASTGEAGAGGGSTAGAAGAQYRGVQAGVAAALQQAMGKTSGTKPRPDHTSSAEGRDFGVFAHDLLAAMSASGAMGRNGRRPDGADPGQSRALPMPVGSRDAGRRNEIKVTPSEGARRAAPIGRIEIRQHLMAAPVSIAPRRAVAPTLASNRDRRTQRAFGQSMRMDTAAGTDATRPTAPNPTGVLTGEIIVDGTRFGRLICDRLTRHIDHPRSGLTQADPRLTPAWPGAAWG